LPEVVLTQILTDTLSLENFDADAFEENIDKIIVPENNHLEFVLADGTRVCREWKNRPGGIKKESGNV